jgi:hypothetical protein
MEPNNIEEQASLILEEWVASLRSRDRTRNAVTSNFEDLFEKLKKANTPFKVAHGLLPAAIKAHQPTSGVIRNYYKIIKKETVKSEQEFAEEWKQSIKDAGTEAFYIYFSAKPKDEEEDPEPKVYGNMSAREYKLQRRYADSFPVLDTTELEKRWLEPDSATLDDLEDVLGKHGKTD